MVADVMQILIQAATMETALILHVSVIQDSQEIFVLSTLMNVKQLHVRMGNVKI